MTEQSAVHFSFYSDHSKRHLKTKSSRSQSHRVKNQSRGKVLGKSKKDQRRHA